MITGNDKEVGKEWDVLTQNIKVLDPEGMRAATTSHPPCLNNDMSGGIGESGK